MKLKLLWPFIALLLCASGAKATSVSVTIKPVHSIVAAVTEGVIVPELILDGTVSPHIDRVKPSMLMTLRESDILIWVGAGIETFLVPAVQQLPESVAVITLSEEDLPVLLPLRAGHDHGHHTNKDQHLWLDPVNAAAIADLLAERLSLLKPQHSQRFKQNAEQFKSTLDNISITVTARLAGVSSAPYLLFHDSLQYFEQRFDLNNAGIVTYEPQVAASAKHLRQLRNVIKDKQVACIFTEPQFEARTIRSLVNDTSIRYATLDPLASTYDAGATLYAQWFADTATSIIDCVTVSSNDTSEPLE